MLLVALMTMSLNADAPSQYDDRARDWRVGPVVYQVFVDRFTPPKDPAKKQRIFVSPRSMKSWVETPHAGKFVASAGLWSHELEFWGGDLQGIRSKLPYIRGLGADVLYLTPIFRALTNHKYDTQDYMSIAPEFGTQKDLSDLITRVHQGNMRILLDGVFNHIGRTSSLFQEALKNPGSKRRPWFYFDSAQPSKYRAWAGAANLPALRLENPDVQNYLWKGNESVVRRYLKDGIDGWRLDVAFELGDQAMAAIRKAAHETKSSSFVVGEINGYPADWQDSVDGVFNFYSMGLAIKMVQGQIEPPRVGQMLDDLACDAGIEHLLRSWLITDNHDTARLATIVQDSAQRRLVQALQFTLPGAPVVYYGSELGMEGKGDPENRAPMRWDLATKNSDLEWIRKLIRIRRQAVALRSGDFRLLRTKGTLGFARITDKVRECAIVFVNPSNEVQRESVGTRFGKAMSWGELKDALTGYKCRSVNGILDIQIPPRSAMILRPITSATNGNSPYERVK